MKSNKDRNALLRQAQHHLNIQSVDLRNSSVSTNDAFTSQTASQFEEILIQSRKDLLLIKFLHGENEVAGSVAIEYSLGTRLVTDKDDEQVLLEVEAVFSANYLISDENLSHEAIKVFAEENGLFHVWPYWREYVQSTCLRVGVPPIPIEMRPGSVETDGISDEHEKLPLPIKNNQ